MAIVLSTWIKTSSPPKAAFASRTAKTPEELVEFGNQNGFLVPLEEAGEFIRARNKFGTSGPGASRLPFTGGETGLLAMYGALLAGLGTAITAAARRRRPGAVS